MFHAFSLLPSTCNLPPATFSLLPYFMPTKIQNLYDTVSRLLRHEATDNLKNLLHKLHPADIAEIVRRSNVARQDQLLTLLHGSEHEPEIFAQLGSSFLEEYLKRHQNYEAVVEKLQRLPSDDVADLVGELPEEMSQALLDRMKMEQSQTVTGLLQYQEETAGGLMSTEVFKLVQETTAGQAIKALQKAKKAVTIFYIYVVDEFDHLTGVVTIRQLFQVKENETLKNIMLRDVVRVSVDESQEEVARIVAQYDVVAIPVVDNNNKLAGVITVDDVIDVIKEEAQENVLKMGSAEVEALEEFNFLQSLKKRLPWFLVLFVGGIFTCEVITHFYHFLPPLGIFAGFIPLILRFGGIITRQTSTIIIQSIASDTMRTNTALKMLFQQGQVTFVIAVLSAGLVAGYSFLRFQEISLLPLGVSISLFCSMMAAVILGVFIPIGFHKIKLDPVLATGSLINFVLDVLGLVIYFRVLIWLIT